ncbi:MAG: right-handed parallel beta-helix repeat-containing protein [Pseudomonadota bacterium]
MNNRIASGVLLVCATLMSTTALCSPRHYEVHPTGNLKGAVASLQPGDELVLRQGTYTFSERIVLRLNGTPAKPIVIRAADNERVTLTQTSRWRNIVEVRDSSHLVIRGMHFTGGSQGIRLINSNYITIEDCEVSATGDVAIAANAGGTYEGLTLRRNHIHHTSGHGEGIYLGCNRDTCRVANSVVEGNYIHHTNSFHVSQGDGIELKEGSYGNVIRDNVVHDTNYPGILVYSTANNGPPNVVEGNVVWNSDDNTVQIAADTIFRNNIVLGNVSLQRHQSGRPGNIEFVHNTIISDRNGLDVWDISGPILIANNAIFSRGNALRLLSRNRDLVNVQGNVIVGRVLGTSSGFVRGSIADDMVDGHFRGQPPIDLSPSERSSLIGAAVEAFAADDDFWGQRRTGPSTAGAYHARAKDGTPQVTRGFKHTAEASPTAESQSP